MTQIIGAALLGLPILLFDEHPHGFVEKGITLVLYVAGGWFLFASFRTSKKRDPSDRN